jgi:hypothetical protein
MERKQPRQSVMIGGVLFYCYPVEYRFEEFTQILLRLPTANCQLLTANCKLRTGSLADTNKFLTPGPAFANIFRFLRFCAGILLTLGRQN